MQVINDGRRDEMSHFTDKKFTLLKHDQNALNATNYPQFYMSTHPNSSDRLCRSHVLQYRCFYCKLEFF